MKSIGDKIFAFFNLAAAGTSIFLTLALFQPSHFLTTDVCGYAWVETTQPLCNVPAGTALIASFSHQRFAAFPITAAVLWCLAALLSIVTVLNSDFGVANMLKRPLWLSLSYHGLVAAAVATPIVLWLSGSPVHMFLEPQVSADLTALTPTSALRDIINNRLSAAAVQDVVGQDTCDFPWSLSSDGPGSDRHCLSQGGVFYRCLTEDLLTVRSPCAVGVHAMEQRFYFFAGVSAACGVAALIVGWSAVCWARHRAKKQYRRDTALLATHPGARQDVRANSIDHGWRQWSSYLYSANSQRGIAPPKQVTCSHRTVVQAAVRAKAWTAVAGTLCLGCSIAYWVLYDVTTGKYSSTSLCSRLWGIITVPVCGLSAPTALLSDMGRLDGWGIVELTAIIVAGIYCIGVWKSHSAKAIFVAPFCLYFPAFLACAFLLHSMVADGEVLFFMDEEVGLPAMVANVTAIEHGASTGSLQKYEIPGYTVDHLTRQAVPPPCEFAVLVNPSIAVPGDAQCRLAVTDWEGTSAFPLREIQPLQCITQGDLTLHSGCGSISHGYTALLALVLTMMGIIAFHFLTMTLCLCPCKRQNSIMEGYNRLEQASEAEQQLLTVQQAPTTPPLPRASTPAILHSGSATLVPPPPASPARAYPSEEKPEGTFLPVYDVALTSTYDQPRPSAPAEYEPPPLPAHPPALAIHDGATHHLEVPPPPPSSTLLPPP